uniref:collagen-like triple helix repeat-containing protein n=1 Tax=Alloprevotella sp. TaxID=1872471 RepID=UPI003FF030FB
NYYLVLEGDDTHGYGGFQADDYIRCQRWTSSGARGYWVRVSFIGSTAGGHNNVLAINRSEFDAAIVEPQAGEVDAYDHAQEVTAQVAQLVTDDRTALITADDGTTELFADDSDATVTGLMVRPEVGDELVQYGNATDPTRQSAIYIHANGTGQPAIDLLTGITSKSFVGCLACRLGGYLPTGGFGLYAKNGQIISLSPDGQTTHYSLNPDGSFELGQGAIKYNGKGNVTIGNNVTINWGPQSQTTYKWAVSDNGTSAPGSGWSSTFPTDVAQGKYIWKRTTYPDGTETTELIGFVGKDGVKGDPGPVGPQGPIGPRGDDGADGTSIHSNLLVHTDFAPKAENYAGTWLNFRSSLATINGTLNEGAAVGDTDMLSASVSAQTDIYRYDVTKLLSPQTWYVIGITMRGTGTATVYCYPDTNEQTIYVDGKAKDSPSDASAEFALTSTWRRHYIAFVTKSSLSGTKYVLVRLSSGAQADIAMVTLGRPYGGGSALTADGYIQNDAQLIRMATPSNMETFCGINSLCAWRSSEREFDFYSQALGSTIMSGQWYTLSFYARGSGNLNTYVYDYGGRILSDASADMPLADGVKETAFNNDGSHTWELTAEWVRHIYTFRVRTDGTYSSPLLLFRATIGTSGDFIAINQVKLEVGKTASDWCLNEMDKKAVSLPDWLKAFNGYTMSGDNYIASGNAFFGRKEIEDGTYTGCMMSSNGLQIGGNTVVGLYALDHNILKVAIDPVHQQYYFKGKVYADEGVFKGTIYADQGVFNGITTGMQLNSVTTIDTTNCENYLELRTFDVTGTTTAKTYTKYAYPIIPNLSTIINVNSLPETVTVDESTADTKIKVTKNYRCWKLPPYGIKDEDIQQALSLIGRRLIIYNNVGSYEIALYGRFFKTGETDFKAKLTLAKGLVALTMCVGTDGQFYWQYDGAIAELKVDKFKFAGTLKPGTGFSKAEIAPPFIKPNN